MLFVVLPTLLDVNPLEILKNCDFKTILQYTENSVFNSFVLLPIDVGLRL